MSGFVPVRMNQFVKQYLRNNKDADGDTVRAAVEDALAAWRQGVRCACGNPLWVAGSAVAGYGCFTAALPDRPNRTAIRRSMRPVTGFFLARTDPEDQFAQVSEIIKKYPRDYRERLEEVGFEWQDDEYDLLLRGRGPGRAGGGAGNGQPAAAGPLSGYRRPRHPAVFDAYLEERYSETSNLPLIRKYFKQANPNLKAILLKGLAGQPHRPGSSGRPVLFQ
jgi:hypothetical protein